MELLLILVVLGAAFATIFELQYMLGFYIAIFYGHYFKVSYRGHLWVTGGCGLMSACFIDSIPTAVFLLGLYYSYFYYDNSEISGVRRWDAFIDLPIWKGLSNWYRHQVILLRRPDSGMPADSVGIYGCHPHGVLALSAALSFILPHEEFGRVRLAIHAIQLAIPGLRDVMLWLGCVDAGEASIRRTLLRGEGVAIVPGGVSEIGVQYKKNNTRRPEGFLRIAFATLSPATPVYFKNEEKVCWIWQGEPSWLTAIRGISARHIRFPFPTFFMIRRPSKVPALETYVGNTIFPQDHESLESFCAAYWAELRCLQCCAANATD